MIVGFEQFSFTCRLVLLKRLALRKVVQLILHLVYPCVFDNCKLMFRK